MRKLLKKFALWLAIKSGVLIDAVIDDPDGRFNIVANGVKQSAVMTKVGARQVLNGLYGGTYYLGIKERICTNSQ